VGSSRRCGCRPPLAEPGHRVAQRRRRPGAGRGRGGRLRLSGRHPKSSVERGLGGTSSYGRDEGNAGTARRCWSGAHRRGQRSRRMLALADATPRSSLFGMRFTRLPSCPHSKDGSQSRRHASPQPTRSKTAATRRRSPSTPASSLLCASMRPAGIVAKVIVIGPSLTWPLRAS
jgi:hypothetical protein